MPIKATKCVGSLEGGREVWRGGGRGEVGGGGLNCRTPSSPNCSEVGKIMAKTKWQLHLRADIKQYKTIL